VAFRLACIGCVLIASAACGKTVIESVTLDACRLADCPAPPDFPDVPAVAPDTAERVDIGGELPEQDVQQDTGVPAQPEKCNGKDDDLDGKTDEAGAQGCKDLFIDADKDEFGGAETACLCAPTPPYSALVAGDCDDINKDVHPGASESCFNLADDDCDGEIKLASCEGKTCGGDGCGGSCGSCSGDTQCNAYGQCVSSAVVCFSSCHCPAGNLCNASGKCQPLQDVPPPFPHPPCCSDASACTPPGADCTRADGSTGKCFPQGGCPPIVCQDAGANCGTVPDGCGGMLNCGACPSSQNCGGGKPSACGPGTCTPLSCKDRKAECGTIADGCGGTVYCGECDPGVPCGGGASPNACGGAPSCEEDDESEYLENGEKYYYPFAPGESRTFYFSEKSTKNQGNLNPLKVDLVDMTTDTASNVDLVVKYVGFSCEFAKPTQEDHAAAVAGDLQQGENGIYFGVAGSSFEIVEIPDNPEGYFYVLIINVGTVAEKQMRIGYSDPDSL
jgi:hypothetical protein